MQFTFEEWMGECDEFCVARLGIGIHDMPDLMWRDFYDGGLDPEQAVDTAIEEWVDNGDMPPDLL